MSEERRYRDHEIREILELADREERPRVQPLPPSEGLTASELVEVGREVGLAPDRITRAVAEYEARGVTVRGGSGFGAPPRIGRTVGLQRAPTDQEWEVLVSELRSTFDAKGEVTSRGEVREWSHGNLHAFIEPTGGGYRLRMTDAMPGAPGAFGLGVFFLAFALLILVILLGKDDAGMRFAVPAFFSLIGGGMIAGSRLALPRWMDEREEQMEQVADRARHLLEEPASNA